MNVVDNSIKSLTKTVDRRPEARSCTRLSAPPPSSSLSHHGSMSTSCVCVLLICECATSLRGFRLFVWLSGGCCCCSPASVKQGERENPGFTFLLSDLFLDPSDSCQAAVALEAGPRLHLHRPAVTRSRTPSLALGTCETAAGWPCSDPAQPLPPTSTPSLLQGRHLLGEVVLGRQTDSVTQQPQTPSYTHVSKQPSARLLPQQQPLETPPKASQGISRDAVECRMRNIWEEKQPLMKPKSIFFHLSSWDKNSVLSFHRFQGNSLRLLGFFFFYFKLFSF